MHDLNDRVAVVTGAASGIGRGIARAFAAKGCHVAVADVDVAGAEEIARELEGRGVRSLAVQCDVTELAAVERASFATSVEAETDSGPVVRTEPSLG